MISYQNESGRIFVGGRAAVIGDGQDGLKAWAEHHVRKDPDIKWILGNYVEAENANSNGHIFPLKDLQDYSVATIANKPFNMLHHGRYVIGSLVAAQMVDGVPKASGEQNSVVEVLSGMWPTFFKDEAALLQRAHDEGALYYSMECVPASITCPVGDCGVTAAWAGFEHESYCAHMNASRVSQKRLNMPHFNAGAAIVPPVQPGWSGADITDIQALLKQHADKAEQLYSDLQDDTPHLNASAWERMMKEIIVMAETGD